MGSAFPPLHLVVRAGLDRVDGVYAAVALAIAGWYLTLEVGPVMDDWFTLGLARFDGALRAAGADQIRARPAGSLVYALVFGVFGRAVVPTVLLLAGLRVIAAALLRRLVALVAPPGLASVVALLWLALPTTTSLEVWASASNIAVGLVAALGACWLAVSVPEPTSPWRLAGIGAVAGAAILSYEALLPLLGGFGAACFAATRLRPARRAAVALLIGTAAALAWSVTHWHPAKDVGEGWGELTNLVPATLGWGIAPPSVGPFLAGAVITGSVATVVGPFARSEVRPLLVTGWGVLIGGALPFVKYTYRPLGAGDRLLVVSSIGGAMIVAGTIAVLARDRRWIAVALSAAVLGLAFEPRTVQMRSWAASADDARAMLAAVVVEARDQPGTVVLGPGTVVRNGTAGFQDSAIFEQAVRLVLEDADRRAELIEDGAAFDAAPPPKIDVRVIIDDPAVPGRRL